MEQKDLYKYAGTETSLQGKNVCSLRLLFCRILSFLGSCIYFVYALHSYSTS